jgi:predicted nucleic acid-binding protein
VRRKAKVFLDTSVLFAAVASNTGSSRMILKLGELGALSLWVGPNVLKEIDSVLERKSPESKPLFALLLHAARVNVGRSYEEFDLELAASVIDYFPDAQILAEAVAAGVDFFVSLDRKHFVDNERVGALPFQVGTPGDFLAWYRQFLVGSSQGEQG